MVGLTEITVDYSSPGVKGRKIWGGLVPYDQMWRAGANPATKVTFSKDVTFAGKPVPAGTLRVLRHPDQGRLDGHPQQEDRSVRDRARLQAEPTICCA